MNKSNKVLLGVLSFVVVCVVGYALFSETITVTGTATAKGNFEITTSIIDFTEVYGPDNNGEDGIVLNSSAIAKNNIITTSATLGAPGSEKWFVVKVENTGSIPAHFKSVTDENGNELTDEHGLGWYGDVVTNNDKTTYMEIGIWPDANYFDDYEDGPYTHEVIPDNDVLREAILDPGEVTYYYIGYYWSDRSTSQEELSLTWKAKINWEQVTIN